MGSASAEETPRLTFQSQRRPGAVDRAEVTACCQHFAHAVGSVAAQGYHFPLNSQPSRMIEEPRP